MTHLSALPVVVPFLVGPLLVAVGFFAPRWAEDTFGAMTAIAVTALCVLLAVHAGRAPVRLLAGRLATAHGVTIGISLSIDVLGAGWPRSRR